VKTTQGAWCDTGSALLFPNLSTGLQQNEVKIYQWYFERDKLNPI